MIDVLLWILAAISIAAATASCFWAVLEVRRYCLSRRDGSDADSGIPRMIVHGQPGRGRTYLPAAAHLYADDAPPPLDWATVVPQRWTLSLRSAAKSARSRLRSRWSGPA